MQLAEPGPKATFESARDRYGERNYELLEWSREVRNIEVDRYTAGMRGESRQSKTSKKKPSPRLRDNLLAPLGKERAKPGWKIDCLTQFLQMPKEQVRKFFDDLKRKP